MISQPSRHCAVELQALPSRIGQVRRIVSAQLRYWHLDDLIDGAALGVTELLTNVHRHAEPDKTCTVEIELLLDVLTVSVRDRDPRVPEVREAGFAETGGRGLALVAAVSESWGVRPETDRGKVVWFTLSAPARESAPPREPVPAGALRPLYAAARTDPFPALAPEQAGAASRGAGRAAAVR
ncbi:ATP-binding protein [Streptomyces sp. NPDC007088]|uniref:ATP-binding protein n=1 Tax=Streptomyces sp. NPDC007088 TaxID=3364773 RepID=UPI003680AFCD